VNQNRTQSQRGKASGAAREIDGVDYDARSPSDSVSQNMSAWVVDVRGSTVVLGFESARKAVAFGSLEGTVVVVGFAVVDEEVGGKAAGRVEAVVSQRWDGDRDSRPGDMDRKVCVVVRGRCCIVWAARVVGRDWGFEGGLGNILVRSF
jgi:hypothetical protein